MAAKAYDPSLIEHPNRVTPDTDSDPSVRAAFGLSNKFSGIPAQVINFYLVDDFATKLWDDNHQLNKPQNAFAPADRVYGYSPDPRFGGGTGFSIGGATYKLAELNRFIPPHWPFPVRGVTMPEEAFAFVTQTRSIAAGRSPTTLNMPGAKKVDLNTFLFDSTHSAQWIWSLQNTKDFWHWLLDEFGINPPA